MSEAKFRVNRMSEAEIRTRIAALESELVVSSVANPAVPGKRQPQGLEPFTYFVVAFAAHLAAGVAHDLIIDKIKKAFKDKNIE